ncbi:MAG TPA: SgcJ/EcaC family oxidoreductase, partial [Pseudonocardiaceae bacterium]|nr:SgcJ/EcaC family oxidoreductase [Pseudonocardiaceae bacterium]
MSDNATTPTADDVAAVREVPQRIVKAWANNDGTAFGEVFTADGTMVLPGVYLDNSAAISEFMTQAFTGPYQGSRVFGEPLSA